MVLHTPFGDVVMQLDGISVEGKLQRTAPNPRWPEVREAYLLHYDYRSDQRAHGLTCLFQGAFQTGGIESGERLELYSMYCGGGRLSIGVEGDFSDRCGYGYDFLGEYCENGLSIHLLPETRDRRFSFGVAWLESCTKENDVQTWFMADPTVVGRESILMEMRCT